VAWVTSVITIAFPVVVAYTIIGGLPFKRRSVPAFAFAALGFLAFYDGFDLSRMEDARARHGHVTRGWIVERLSSLERNGTRYIGPWGGRDQVRRLPIVTSKGFMLHERLSRWIATGSLNAWVIAYEYPCAAPRCSGRDFVSEAAWSSLRAGQGVDVRTVEGEPYSGRLDDYPQGTLAAIELVLGSLLLLAARLMSGRAFFPRREWLTAPAVVLRVEPVKYPDATHWRIHFAFFDPDGREQESAAEVITSTWKPGDDCIAVFKRTSPDSATMRPCEGTGGIIARLLTNVGR
jgi:hypothetical protein